MKLLVLLKCGGPEGGCSSLRFPCQFALCSQCLAAGAVVADPVLQVLWKLRTFHLSLAQVLHDLVWSAAQNVLAAEHHRGDEAVGTGHELLLQEEGLVVPGQDSAAQLEGLEQGQRAPVADGGRPQHHAGPQGTNGPEDAVAGVEGEACKVTLAQVAGVVHVAHEVDVLGQHPPAKTLFPQDVSHDGLEPGTDNHSHPPHEVPHIQGREEEQKHAQHPQPHLSSTASPLTIANQRCLVCHNVLFIFSVILIRSQFIFFIFWFHNYYY